MKSKVKEIEVKNPKLKDDIARYNEISEKIKELNKEKDLIRDEIQKEGKNTVFSFFKRNKVFVKSVRFLVDGFSCMFSLNDRYKKIDEEEYEELKKKYKDEFVEEKKVSYFNSKILMKYKDQILDILMKSDVIPPEDKSQLIMTDTTYLIRRGSINKLEKMTYKSANKAFEDIEPVFSIIVNKS